MLNKHGNVFCLQIRSAVEGTSGGTAAKKGTGHKAGGANKPRPATAAAGSGARGARAVSGTGTGTGTSNLNTARAIRDAGNSAALKEIALMNAGAAPHPGIRRSGGGFTLN